MKRIFTAFIKLLTPRWLIRWKALYMESQYSYWLVQLPDPYKNPDDPPRLLVKSNNNEFAVRMAYRFYPKFNPLAIYEVDNKTGVVINRYHWRPEID